MNFSPERMKAQLAARRQIVDRMSPAAKSRLLDGKSKHVTPSAISEADFKRRFNGQTAPQVVAFCEYIGLLMEG